MKFGFINSLKRYKREVPVTIKLNDDGTIIATNKKKVNMEYVNEASKVGKMPARARDFLGKEMSPDDLAKVIYNVGEDNEKVSKYHQDKAEYHQKEAERYSDNVKNCNYVGEQILNKSNKLRNKSETLRIKNQEMLKTQENVTPETAEIFKKR